MLGKTEKVKRFDIKAIKLYKKTSLTGRPTILEQKRLQSLLNSMGLIYNSTQAHSSILCLKKEAVGL